MTSCLPAQATARGTEQAAARPRRREVVVSGKRVKTVDVHAHCNFHAADAFPMQSVYKLPIAMAMFDAIEHGRFRLGQNLRFLPSDLISPDQYSPLRDAHPQGNADVPVEELLRLANDG